MSTKALYDQRKRDKMEDLERSKLLEKAAEEVVLALADFFQGRAQIVEEFYSGKTRYTFEKIS